MLKSQVDTREKKKKRRKEEKKVCYISILKNRLNVIIIALLFKILYADLLIQVLDDKLLRSQGFPIRHTFDA